MFERVVYARRNRRKDNSFYIGKGKSGGSLQVEQNHTELVGGSGSVGRHAPGVEMFFVVGKTDFYVRVADVE